MGFIEEYNEVKPSFAPEVQEVWEDCGIYVTSNEPLIAEKELEYFVQCLVKRIGDALEDYSLVTVNEKLQELGYTK